MYNVIICYMPMAFAGWIIQSSFFLIKIGVQMSEHGMIDKISWYVCIRRNACLCTGLAFGIQVRGFKPGRSRRIFQGEKILSTSSFGRVVKPWVPCRWFTACKRSLGVSWKSASRQN
jgi:hypothetical protein